MDLTSKKQPGKCQAVWSSSKPGGLIRWIRWIIVVGERISRTGYTDWLVIAGVIVEVGVATECQNGIDVITEKHVDVGIQEVRAQGIQQGDVTDGG